MAKGKERSINPAQEQRKVDKAKALKKGKAELQARRNEKLARQNPDRLQRQVDDLKALEESNSIKPREKEVLVALEKDLRAVRRAREALGDKAPAYGKKPSGTGGADTKGTQNGLLGKRKWDEDRRFVSQRRQESASASDTDESIRRIPMPKDTPPPIPRRPQQGRGTRANAEPIADNRSTGGQPHHTAQAPVQLQPKTSYESGPQLRDLRKEAVGRFVPNVVRTKQDAIKGAGALIEPEELDRLEQEGYGGQTKGISQQAASEEAPALPTRPSVDLKAAPDHDAEMRRLAEEEEQFRKETKHVLMDEVHDEDL